MKGIILAAGKGTRLYPLTKGVPKVLLPVYDRPMIYYALEFMRDAGVKEVMLVVNAEQESIFRSALGSGAEFGLNITYRVQREVNGTAGALMQTKDFIQDEEVLLYYGDNILLSKNLSELAKMGMQEARAGVAAMLALKVANPTDYGVLEISEEGKILSLEEKPAIPKSNFIALGIYFYPNDLSKKLDDVPLSPRGEYEMTDVNKMYLAEGKLNAIKLDAQTMWFDAGNFDALLEAANIVRDHKREDRSEV